MACVHGHGCRCRCIGALAWGSSWRWFVTHGCSMEGVSPRGPVVSLPGGFIGAYIVCFVYLTLDHIPAGGGISSFHSTGSPKHILLTRLEGWGQDIGWILRRY